MAGVHPQTLRFSGLSLVGVERPLEFEDRRFRALAELSRLRVARGLEPGGRSHHARVTAPATPPKRALRGARRTGQSGPHSS